MTACHSPSRYLCCVQSIISSPNFFYNMKHVLMTLFFFSGLAVTQLAAQTCAPCPPCPPGCCAQIYDLNSKACKPDKKACKNASVASVAMCTPAQVEACKAAGVSCSTTGSAQAVSCKPAGTTQVASCAPVDKSVQRAQAGDIKEPSGEKNTKLVVSKG
jgi:hypothetical protein